MSMCKGAEMQVNMGKVGNVVSSINTDQKIGLK